MVKIDLYNRKNKLRNVLNCIKTQNRISEKNPVVLSEANKNHILKFAREQKRHSPSHQLKMITFLNKLVEYADNQDLASLTKDNLKDIVAKLEDSDYADGTKQSFKVVIKVFYRWLEGIDERNVYPERVRFITTSGKSDNERMPESILTGAEIERMIEATDHIRDKAFIAILYETGARIGEILPVTLHNQIVDDEYGAYLIVDGKTGKRRLRIINSMPYLNMWRENHPYKKDKKTALWVRVGTRKANKMVSYHTIWRMLSATAKKAGIDKRINPHSFRHASATFYASHFSEQQLKVLFGWTGGSIMPGIYTHLSGKVVDDDMLRLRGIVKKDDKENEIKNKTPIKCAICGTHNKYDSVLCLKCSRPLSIQTAIEMQSKQSAQLAAMQPLLDAISKDPKLTESLIEIAAQARADEIIQERKNKTEGQK